MIVSVGSDHAGFPLKSAVVDFMKSKGIVVIDHGSYTPDPVDFPDIAELVCDSVRTGKADRGIMICGTGVGASIAANKIPGIRATVAHDIHSAYQCVEHDDVNVLCVGAKIVGEWLVKDLVDAFLNATFSTEEHFKRRVEKLRLLELKSANELLGNEG